MTTNKCTFIQEEIALGKSLSEEGQLHILSCDACKNIALEFERLDAAMKNSFDVSIPEGFSDRVMERVERIDSESVHSYNDMNGFASLGERITDLLELRPVQIGAAYLGCLFTIGNLARFVFSILLPGKA